MLTASKRSLGDSLGASIRYQLEPPVDVIRIEHVLPSRFPIQREQKTYRNPLIYAMELAEEMRSEGLTQAELARKHGISPARINQWLSLLRLPAGERRRILSMGDHWAQRLLTERNLRRSG